ncbi:hypothetical protein BDN72DRAFT_964613 [Pluteus cervinus]|uniref:Uncharacterized protein n=1 Tax=Pluteus cervinus TaxID=181527 RepID=A0ACD3A9I1_9AGAR|nr:hypothetical protein BDN72DRAFT_964613 [Pluteus cervinus]
MASRLLDLPLELTLRIFLELDPQNLIKCRVVCGRLLEIITNDIELQYLIELFSAGMLDTRTFFPTSGGTIQTSGRLEALRSFIRTRNGLTDLHDFPLDGLRIVAGYTDQPLVQNTFALVRRSFTSHQIRTRTGGLEGPRPGSEWMTEADPLSSRWKHLSGVLCWNEGWLFHFVKPPGKSRGLEMRCWDLDLRERFGEGVLKNDGRLLSCWVDSYQDLLVVPEKVDVPQLKLHFLSLTTGKEHPLALFPTYTTPFYNHLVVQAPSIPWEIHRGASWSYAVDIYDQHMAISVQWEEYPQVVIINWKTGDVLEKWDIPFDFLTFIDAHTIILASAFTGLTRYGASDTDFSHLKIFDLRRVEYSPPGSKVPGSSTTQSIPLGFARPVPLLFLDLLKDVERSQMLDFFSVCNGRTGSGTYSTNSSFRPIFIQNPQVDIITIKVDLISSRCPTFIVTSVGALLDFITANTSERPTPLVPREFALHEWPNCTFPHRLHSRHSSMSVSGSRLLLSLGSYNEVPAQREWHLFDFNTRPWRKEQGDEFKSKENDLLPKNLSTHVGFPVPHIKKIIAPTFTGNYPELTEDHWVSFIRGKGGNPKIGHVAIHQMDDVAL